MIWQVMILKDKTSSISTCSYQPKPEIFLLIHDGGSSKPHLYSSLPSISNPGLQVIRITSPWPTFPALSMSPLFTGGERQGTSEWWKSTSKMISSNFKSN